jgi:hypothetical protein
MPPQPRLQLRALKASRSEYIKYIRHQPAALPHQSSFFPISRTPTAVALAEACQLLPGTKHGALNLEPWDIAGV